MRLDAARLCLDCEEIHEDQVCPICSSEAFAYLTRWVQPAVAREVGPATPTRGSEPPPRASQPRSPGQVEAYRQILEGKPRRRTGFVTGSVLGLAAVSLAGWALRATSRPRETGQGEGATQAGASTGHTPDTQE
jgi:hypothetical protein